MMDTTTEPTIEIINLQITPELEHWMPKISQCANSIEGIGIYSDIVVQKELSISQTDLVFRLGRQTASDPYVAVMGLEEITLLIGSEVPFEALSIDSIRGIFSGEITNWGELPEVLDQEIEINQPIITMSYPEDNILRELFRRSFLENEPIMSNPLIYSTPEGLDRLLQENPYGIAFTLKSHLLENQDPLEISDFNTLLAQEYVLAITNIEPQGNLKQLLLCLQDS
jgi:hypothetical protein